MSGSQSLRLVGGVVPPALVARIQAGEVGNLSSLSPSSYHLVGTETVRDAASSAWAYLRGAWLAWREADASRPAHAAGTGSARERWLLPLLRVLGFGQVPALASGLVVTGGDYPVSHLWGSVPIHLLGPGVDLDRRNPGVAGAARAPQAMVQELLNRTDEYLWAIVSDGLRLRLLRDSTALAGSAYIEFDLEAIFDGELYADFVLFYQLCHQSRFEKRAGPDAPAGDCWLEVWRAEAVDAGTRVLDRLRDGVEVALTALGSGFLAHPANTWLADALRTGELSVSAYHRALLRLVYRMLFCFVAEDRGVLLDPDADAAAKQRYDAYFSTSRMRHLSRLRVGGPHPDLWRSQRLVFGALGGAGAREIAVAPLGGLFDSDPRGSLPQATPHSQRAHGPAEPAADLFAVADLANRDLLTAVRALGWLELRGQRTQRVDYQHLGAEELGSVYESLLELVPRVDLDERKFMLDRVAGNERKSTGSYYTPPALVSALLDTALDPLLDDAVKNAANGADAEVQLLSLTVCDPACGSGGFLVAAARRIARRVAQARSGEDEPTPADVQHALREVAGRCIYGVDVNELAAELAKMSLWLEAMEPGKPLGLLDARIRVGNALLGATPALLVSGVPDDAFKELEGDDRPYARAIRARNRSERLRRQDQMIFGGEVTSVAQFIKRRAALLTPSDDVAKVREMSRALTDFDRSNEMRRAKLHADAWCAAFVWPLQADNPAPPTDGLLRQLAEHGDPGSTAETEVEVSRLSAEYKFFHWHLEFPEVFGDPDADDKGPEGWPGGFSCLLGNPPWERVKLQEQEFFAARDPDIANAPNAATRRRLIRALAIDDPALNAAFLDEKRRAEGQSTLLRNTGRFPLNGRGDVNTYAVFAELFRSLAGPHGRTGVIVPTGIATDATTQYFFKDLVETATLAALYDFENAAPIFIDVHRSFKFCLLTMTGRAEPEDAAAFAFFLHDPLDIAAKQFAMTPEEINLLNPNTGTCPVFRSRRDAEISLSAAAVGLPLWSEASHRHAGIRVTRLGALSDLDRATRMGVLYPWDSARLDLLPVYEAKLFHAYNHRFASYDSGAVRPCEPSGLDPRECIRTRYKMTPEPIQEVFGSDNDWGFLAFRDIARATDERTMLASILPHTGADYTVRLVRAEATNAILLLANFNAMAYDFLYRLRIGSTHLADFVTYQVPVVDFDRYATGTPWRKQLTLRSWVSVRALELAYAWDISSLAKALNDSGPPFVWEDKRRALLRAELDAAYFHLYGVGRDDTDYILDAFPIVKRKDEAAYGEYRSKRLVLEIFDAMQNAIDTSSAYETVLDPPPGSWPRHPAREATS